MLGCGNRKKDLLLLEKHSQYRQREEEKVKSASLDTEVQGSDLIWDRADPFLCFWQPQTMLSFYHKRQNGCGSRISWLLDLWAQALWYVSWIAAAEKADTGHRYRQRHHICESKQGT